MRAKRSFIYSLTPRNSNKVRASEDSAFIYADVAYSGWCKIGEMGVRDEVIDAVQRRKDSGHHLG